MKSGSVLAFSLIILFMGSVIALGMVFAATISTKTSMTTSQSVNSFQVADSGAEIVLQKITKTPGLTTITSLATALGKTCTSGQIEDTTAGYAVTFLGASGDLGCGDPVSSIRRIKSVGEYRTTTRAVSVPVPRMCGAWSTPVPIDPTGESGEYSSIAVGDDGFAQFAYYTKSGNDLKFARCNDLACSSPQTQTVDSGGNVGRYTSIAIGSDGFARISYYDSTNNNGDLKFARCTDDNCTAPIVNTVDNAAANTGEYSSLGLLPDGTAMISYYANGGGDLKFARCSDLNCASGNVTTTTVDSTGTVGLYTSLAIGSDGFARISYFGDTTNDLKFARCTDATCSARNISSFSTAADDGYYTSIALDSANLPRISYLDNSVGGGVKLRRCNDIDCNDAPTTTIDTTSGTGNFGSLVLTSRGIPFLSYFLNNNTGNDAIVFAQCSDKDCSDAPTTQNIASTGSGGVIISGQRSIALDSNNCPHVSYYNGGSKVFTYIHQ